MAEMEKDGQGSEGGPLASGGILIQDLTYFPATLILRSRCRSDLPPWTESQFVYVLSRPNSTTTTTTTVARGGATE